MAAEPHPTNAKMTSNSKAQPLTLSILEKPETDVSYLWKGCQLFTYIVCIISGFCTSLAIGSTRREFNHECVLYGNLTVKINNTLNTVHIPGSILGNTWGDASHCSFSQYAPVATVIFAGIWATLFMMCGRGGHSKSNLPQAWRIVPPALLFSLVFVIIASINVGYIFGGFSAFCSLLVANFEHEATKGSSLFEGAKLSSCDDLKDHNWVGHEPGHFYKQILIAEVSCVITLIAWIAGLLLLIGRCVTHADFQVISSDTATPESETTQLNSSQSELIPTRDQNPLIAVEVSKG